MTFSRQANPVWLFTDLEGNILDDNYWISFLQNTIPYLPKPIYQTDQGPSGAVWSDPLQFHPDGTLPDNMYFEDGAVYRLEIRRGPTQADPLIRLIENFVATGGGITPVNTGSATDNQITNPQFAFTLFNNSVVINNTGNNSYDIAPGWVLDLDSTAPGVVTLTRTAIAGNNPTPVDGTTNPSYVLQVEVTSGIFTVVNLRQRFDHAPAIWAEEGVSVSFIAKVLAGAPVITVNYTPSNGTAYPIVSQTLSTIYQTIAAGRQIPASNSSDTGANGYIDMVFTLPVTGTTFITNVQVIGSAVGAALVYNQTTVERQHDQTYHYYADSILLQPKESLLAGWTFGLNPWQFTDPASANVATNSYTADQTIMIQQKLVADNVGNNVAVGRGTAAQNYAYAVTAVTDDNQFAICQYIDPSTIRPYWGKKLSCMVNARIALGAGHTSAVNVKVRLLYRVDLPAAIGRAEPIASWIAGQDPTTYAAGWTALKPINDPSYLLTSGDLNFAFDQFQLPASSADNMTLAILVYTVGTMNSAATADAILIDRVSLIANDFAIDANVETFDSALRKCQFYFEKSYNSGVLPGATTLEGAQTTQLATATGSIGGIDRPFKVEKRRVPLMTWYSTAGATAARIRDLTTNADFTVTANHNVGKTSTGYVDTSAPGADGDLMGGQWTAGARLGLTGEL